MPFPDPDCPLSLAHLSEIDVPPAALIELAAEAEIASVCIRLMAATPGGIAHPLRTAAEQMLLRRISGVTGVDVLHVELIPLCRDREAAEFREMLETGAAIGASRCVAAGDDPDPAVVADRLAGVAEIAREYGIAVDLEFMPYRGVRTLREAVAVIEHSGAPNAHVMLDALHFYRSGGVISDLADIAPGHLGCFQLCDAPIKAPPPSDLATEARTRRLLPGDGGLALEPLMNELPRNLPIGLEVPMRGLRPDLDPVARLRLLVQKTRDFLIVKGTP